MELQYRMRDILPLLPIPQPVSGRSSYNIQCPVCDKPGSRERHLNINLKRNVFRCPKCGQFQGGVFDLYAYYMNVSREDVRDILDGRLGGKNHGARRKKLPDTLTGPNDFPQTVLAGIDARDRVYQALLDRLALAPDHSENLLGRGLSDAEIARLGYRTAPLDGLDALAQNLVNSGCDLSGVPGFFRAEDGCWTMAFFRRGIIIPCRDRCGRIQSLHIRLDQKLKRGGKFLTFSSTDKPDGAGAENWCHLAGPVRESVLLIEGYMKADIVHYFTGQTVLAIPGVTSLHHLERTLRELIGRGVRHVMTCFDMDYLKNWHVENAYANLVELLGSLPLTFGTYLWSPEYNGLDDYIWEACLGKRHLI